jgi:beta-lactamase class D
MAEDTKKFLKAGAVDEFIAETRKEVKKKLEAEIEATKTFDPNKFFKLITGLIELKERKLITEEDFKELNEKLKKRMSEVL